MELSNTVYIRDLQDMTECSEQMRLYVQRSRVLCEELINIFKCANANATLGGVAGSFFVDTLYGWVRGVLQTLPEAEGLQKALEEAVEVYRVAEARLRKHIV